MFFNNSAIKGSYLVMWGLTKLAAMLATGLGFVSAGEPQECRINLHAHFEALLPPVTITSMAKKNNITLPEDMWKFQQTFFYPSFQDFADAYFKTILPIQNAQDYYDGALAALKRFKEIGTCYSEIKFCPDCIVKGVDWQDAYVEIKRAIEESEVEGVFYTRLILTFVRGLTNETNAVSYVDWIVEQHQKGDKLIVGIDVSGNEAQFPDLSPYVAAYAAASKASLKKTVHAGELQGPEAVDQAILLLNPDRIGHGISAINSSETLERLRKNNIPLEVNIKSNVCLSAQNITSYIAHPFYELLQANVTVVLGSDDDTLFGSSILEEEGVILDNFPLTQKDIWGIYNTSITHSFAPEELKARLYQMWEQAYSQGYKRSKFRTQK